MKERRKDYQAIDAQIKQAYFDYIKKYNKLPTQSRVAKILGISFPTVNKHLRSYKLEDITPQFKQFAPEVIFGLMNKAMKGESKAAKLFFHLVYDWSEKQDINLHGDINMENKLIIEIDEFFEKEEKKIDEYIEEVKE